MSDFFDDLRQNPNNFSFWYPKIADCGLKVPKSIIFQLPEDVIRAIFHDRGSEDDDIILSYVKETMIPVLVSNNMFKPGLFIKNGTFSNKFRFNDSCGIRMFPNAFELTNRISNICYEAEMVGAAGISEIIIREFIGLDNDSCNTQILDTNIPCIYGGMPLRPEFRVFYDFDNREVIKCVNYWDYDYCHDTIAKNYTDKIVYEHYYPTILNEYETRKDTVISLVSDHMKNVDMTGKWSVDIMYDVVSDSYYLIDMAQAQRSAYWND